MDYHSFVHPNIINSELDEFLLRLPKTPNLPKIESFGVLPLFDTGRGTTKVGGDEGKCTIMPNAQCPMPNAQIQSRNV
ncbi:hypothetical protein [Nostoc sp. CALU 546]|uniref:hypothetical protein n=1 Tax=Nostoc sp. CALU 546 TaxID=1867241 RepID=UPI003B66C486